MILVLGTVDELVSAWFMAHLVARERPFVFVDERQLGAEVRIELQTGGDDADGVSGRICFPRWQVALGDISGIFSRLGTGSATLPETAAARAERAHAAALLDMFPGPVANRSTAAWSNASKPAQYGPIIAAGFGVPDTLVATGWPRARRLLDSWDGDAIVKSTGGVRSLVKAVTPAQVRGALIGGASAPHQVQRRVVGHNVRVHLIGGRTALACRAITEAIDYRHPDLTGHGVRLEAIVLPPRVADACRRLARDLELGFGGIDLVEPPGGSPDPADWFCFEVNTCPGYLWFEQHADLRISVALADWLGGRA